MPPECPNRKKPNPAFPPKEEAHPGGRRAPTGYQAEVTTSVVDVLEEQHRRISDLFDRVASPDEDRPAVLHVILRELAAHVAAERAAVRPVVDDRGIGEGLGDQLRHDYDRMEKLMVLIERRKFNSPDVPDLVSELKGVVDEHRARAESELIPGLREKLTTEEQADLGEKVTGEDAMVTSHPHPHLLSLGPLGDLLTRVAQKWDQARDRTAVNRQHPEDEGKQHVTKVAGAWSGVRGNRGPEPGESEPDGDLRPKDYRM